MGLREFFEIKSLKQKKLEQQQYNLRAFPYGRDQLQRVNDLILELMPDEKQTGMAVFLMGKEAYGENRRMENACRAMQEYLPGKHRKKIFLFLALIAADWEIDENLDYPDAEMIKEQAKELEKTL